MRGDRFTGGRWWWCLRGGGGRAHLRGLRCGVLAGYVCGVPLALAVMTCRRWCGRGVHPRGRGGELARAGGLLTSGGLLAGAYGVARGGGRWICLRRGPLALAVVTCAGRWQGILAPAWFPLHVSGGLRGAHGAPEVVAGCTCAGIGSPAGGWWPCSPPGACLRCSWCVFFCASLA